MAIWVYYMPLHYPGVCAAWSYYCPCCYSQSLRIIPESACRLGDLLAVQNSMSSHQPAAALVQQRQQAPLHRQQHTEQQQQQELLVEQQQQQQQHKRDEQQQQQHEHDLPIVGTNEMAEALGRLCQAASRKQRLAHARPDGKASSSGSSSPAHASRQHSPKSRTADATSSGRSTPEHGSHGRSQHSRPGLVGSSRSMPTGVYPDKLAHSSAPASTAVSPATDMTGNSRDSDSDSRTGPAHSRKHGSPGAATVARSEHLLRAFVEADSQARNAKPAAEEAHVAMLTSEQSSGQEPAHTAATAAGSAMNISADDAAADSRAVSGTAASGTVLLLQGAMQEAAVSSVPTGHSSQHASLAATMLQQLHSAAALPPDTNPGTAAPRPTAVAETCTCRQQFLDTNDVAAHTGDFETAVDATSDATVAAVPQARSDSMQAQTPLAQEGNSDNMLALSPLQQSADSARAASSHPAVNAEGQEATPSGQEAAALGQEASAIGQEATAPEQEASASGQAATALQPKATAPGQEPMALPESDGTIPSGIASEGSFDVLGVGGVTPPARGVQSVLDSMQNMGGAEMQSPNKSKYARSESRQAGTRIADHPVGELDSFFPEVSFHM